MMKAAEAINAMQSTLRPGREEVLRNPRRATCHIPCPSIVRLFVDLNQADQRQIRAIMSRVPAPKKPPTCPITFNAEANNSKSPNVPKKIASLDAEEKFTLFLCD